MLRASGIVLRGLLAIEGERTASGGGTNPAMGLRVNPRVPLFATFSLTSITAFALLARAVAKRETAPIDREIHEQTKIDKGEPGREAAEKVSPIGKWFTYVPAAVLAGAYVLARRDDDEDRDETRSRISGMAAIVTAAVVAASVNHLFDDLLPQPPPPPGRPPDHPVFPSGHAFGTMSVALTAAYVLAREELAPAAVVFPLAMIVPVVSSAARMIEEKHWISDVLGGYLAAAGLAAAALTGYEAVRGRRRGWDTARLKPAAAQAGARSAGRQTTS